MRTVVEEHFDMSMVPTSELAKMVRKLRWIGMEDEARQLQIALSAFPAGERETVLAGAPSTD
jgi:hypothetical protein